MSIKHRPIGSDRKTSTRNTSGVTGVYLHKVRGLEYWKACGHDASGKTIHLGYAKVFGDAVKLRTDWELALKLERNKNV
jgi:hypothetical protein